MYLVWVTRWQIWFSFSKVLIVSGFQAARRTISQLTRSYLSKARFQQQWWEPQGRGGSEKSCLPSMWGAMVTFLCTIRWAISQFLWFQDLTVWKNKFNFFLIEFISLIAYLGRLTLWCFVPCAVHNSLLLIKLHWDHTLAVLLDYDIKQQSLQEGLTLWLVLKQLRVETCIVIFKPLSDSPSILCRSTVIAVAEHPRILHLLGFEPRIIIQGFTPEVMTFS